MVLSWILLLDYRHNTKLTEKNRKHECTIYFASKSQNRNWNTEKPWMVNKCWFIIISKTGNNWQWVVNLQIMKGLHCIFAWGVSLSSRIKNFIVLFAWKFLVFYAQSYWNTKDGSKESKMWTIHLRSQLFVYSIDYLQIFHLFIFFAKNLNNFPRQHIFFLRFRLRFRRWPVATAQMECWMSFFVLKWMSFFVPHPPGLHYSISVHISSRLTR